MPCALVRPDEGLAVAGERFERDTLTDGDRRRARSRILIPARTSSSALPPGAKFAGRFMVSIATLIGSRLITVSRSRPFDPSTPQYFRLEERRLGKDPHTVSWRG